MVEGGGNHKRLVKAAMKDAPLIVLLLFLGLLQFGWVFWPELGIAWDVANASLCVVILLLFGVAKIFRR
ncbi:hypothetical protein ACYOEI_01155 [Singulisphaera rosea]